MAALVTFELVSPERLLASMQASQVVVPGEEGDFGVLSGHMPVMSTLRPGVVEVSEDGKAEPTKLFVGGGFVEVADDRVTILAEDALALTDADAEKTARDLSDAREDLADAKTDHEKHLFQVKVKKLEALSEILARQ
ncbi:MAG: F0F1 ATP synthase subunit epsilon [Sphingomonadales bacterium]|jgi:F-type H+-transporting ATPase subunit epsilon